MCPATISNISTGPLRPHRLYYIKRFEEETNLRCHILLDRSASMGYGTGLLTKWDYSCFLATCMAYLMVRQQDAVAWRCSGRGPVCSCHHVAGGRI